MDFSTELSSAERQQIQQWVVAHGTPQQVALRCRIVLAAAEGQSDVAIAEQLSVTARPSCCGDCFAMVLVSRKERSGLLAGTVPLRELAG